MLDLSQFEQNYQPYNFGQATGQKPQPQKGKPSFLQSLFPTIGGIGGGALGGAAGGALAGSAILPGIGTAAGGLIGALLGGATGGAAGKVAENAATGQSLAGGVGGQALEQGVLSAGPLRLLKGAKAAAGVVKAGIGAKDVAQAGGALAGRATGIGGGVALNGVDQLTSSLPKGIPVKFADSTLTGSSAIPSQASTNLVNPSVGAIQDALNALRAKGYQIGKSTLSKSSTNEPLVTLAGSRSKIPLTAGSEASGVLPGKTAGLSQDALKTAASRAASNSAPLPQAAASSSLLADALNAAGAAANKPGVVRTAIGNKLGDISESQASKALGLTKGQKNKILETTGEKAGAIARRYDITDASQVANATKPLYDQFSKAVGAIPRTFTKDEIAHSFKSIYNPMLAEGAPLGQQNVGNAIKAEAENLLKGVGVKGITATELNAKRQAFDKLAYKAKGTDPQMYDVNKQARDVLANMVHGAADSAGIKTEGGQTLKQLGKEINKVERLGKAANKNIEGAGGHMALGLGELPGAVMGSAAGPAGAVGGYAANKVLSSTAGRKATSAVLDKAATKAAGGGSANPFGVGAIASRSAPVGLVGALSGQAASMNMPNSQADITTTNPIANAANIDTQSQNSPDLSSDLSTGQDGGQGSQSLFDPSNIEANVQQILQNGGKLSDAAQYIAMAKQVNDIQKAGLGKSKQLTSQQQKDATNAQSGLASLSKIQQTLQQNPHAAGESALPGGSLTARLTGTGDYRAAVNNASDVIGRLRSGGAIQDDEARRYLAMLPSAFDDPQTANYKLQTLGTIFSQIANPEPAQADNSDLLAALGVQQ
jgi:hypothetical protein